MKRLSYFILILSVLLLCGCNANSASYDVVATTLPVFDFASAICQGTDITVGRLVSESVSCLHDYTLQVSQMRMLAGADAVVISGAGLEEFLDDAMHGVASVIDASADTHMHEGGHSHEHHEDHEDHGHDHDTDPHIWLSPENAKIMAQNICTGLSETYPDHQETFLKNLEVLIAQLDALQVYGDTSLTELSCRELITFHDGFAYFAESFDLTILEAVEEESGSEASAAQIIHLVELVEAHHIPSIFTETNGSDACAGIIHAETGANIFTLDMAMSGSSYFDAMYHNINTIKEALG